MTAKITEFPGTGLHTQDFAEKRILTTHWVPKAEYAWDAGVAIGRYLAELKNGKLVGVRCHHCQRTVIPPRVFCEECFQPMDEFVELPDTGTINTFSVCFVKWDMTRITEPLIPAVIEIDGTNHAGILHLLGEVGADHIKTLKVGMRVQAVWKPAEEREGAITDIRYFKVIRDA
jgi:uncharacterized OB-fold protein